MTETVAGAIKRLEQLAPRHRFQAADVSALG
jgi:hypothetical protein